MLQYIEEAINAVAAFEETFNFIVPENVSTTEFTGIFYAKIEKFNQSIYKQLNLSLLAGEYISFENYNEKLSEFELTFSNISTENIQNFDLITNINEKLQFQSALEISKSYIKTSLNQLHSFILKIKTKISNSDEIILFNLRRKTNIDNAPDKNPFAPLFYKYFKIFGFNIRLSYLDAFLKVSENGLTELLGIKRELNDLILAEGDQVSPRVLLLFDKANYLILKIKYRFDNRELPKRFIYAFDAKEENLDDIIITNPEIEALNQLTLSHYYDEGNIPIKRRYNDIKNKEKASYLSQDYHTAIKYFKDEVKKKNVLLNICDDFEEKINVLPIEDQFDNNANNTLINYLRNNHFSLLCDNNEDIKDVKKFLEIIEDIQVKTNINNFFPYKKYCNYLVSAIDEKINNYFEKENFAELSEVRDSIEGLKNELLLYANKYEKSFFICKSKDFYSFQLPFSESVYQIKIRQGTYPLFLFSSFILPIDYDEEFKLLKLLQTEVERIKMLVESKTSVKQKMLELKSLQNSLDLEIKSTDKKYIEILGVFSAIVIFSAGSFQLFSREKISHYEAVQLMFAFGFSLSLFVMVLWIFTNPIKLKKINPIQWVLIGLIVITTILLGFHYYSHDVRNLFK